MPKVEVFQVTSNDIAEGLPLPPQQYAFEWRVAKIFRLI